MSVEAFEMFWSLCVRRVAKKDARRAWARIPAAKYPDVIAAAEQWRRIWLKQEIEFIPHPATWLNGERWEDEIPVANRISCAAHVVATLPPQGEKTPMPDGIRATIHKMRGVA